MDPLPTSVVARLAYLHESKPGHHEIAEKLMKADGGKLFGVDLIAFAVLHRSLALIDGFTILVEARNPLAAIPLVRLQLDSMLRFFASSLTADPNTVLEQLLSGEPLGKIKSRDGKKLNDSNLAAEAEKVFPGVEDVYKQACGFVHFSVAHMTNPVAAIEGDARQVEFAIGVGRGWSEKEMLDTVDAFIKVTKTLLIACASWLGNKEKVAGSRPAATKGTSGEQA